jgi:putative transposase
MARPGLKARHPKRFKVTADSNHNGAISPNSQNLQFGAKAPNQAWTTDITYIWALEGWLYLAVVIDLFSRQVVGWAVADHMKTTLCVSAPQMAFCEGNQGRDCSTTRIGVANMPAVNTDNIWLS